MKIINILLSCLTANELELLSLSEILGIWLPIGNKH